MAKQGGNEEAKDVLTGTFSAAGQSPIYTPTAGKTFNVTLWGTFGASVQLERSFDEGANWHPITAAGTQLYVWTGAASEVAEDDEPGIQYRLNCTSWSSGTVNYRMSQ